MTVELKGKKITEKKFKGYNYKILITPYKM